MLANCENLIPLFVSQTYCQNCNNTKSQLLASNTIQLLTTGWGAMQCNGVGQNIAKGKKRDGH